MGLGVIDFKTKVPDKKLTYDMRKKRLAFGKAAFFASMLTLWMID